MDVVKELKVRSSKVFANDTVYRDGAGKYYHLMPKFIGPDRGTVEHSKNVLSSFTGKSRVRPAYLNYIDIVGTQSRLGDQSGQKNEWKSIEKVISQGSVLNLWCTLCAHQWDRMPNEYLRDGKKL